MKGDFTRFTFAPGRRFSRVLMQQGRVQLDADWNEQADIFTYLSREVTKDVIGHAAGPAGRAGFAIGAVRDGDFPIGYGRYYVDGILCDHDVTAWNADGNPMPFLYSAQPGYPFPDSLAVAEIAASNGDLLIFLDVWERLITAHEIDDIREIALGGPDTATRAQVVWQVKVIAYPELPAGADVAVWLAEQFRGNSGRLAASTKGVTAGTDPCTAVPTAGYRGLENQLYRVEVHRGGPAGVATFKWSRDNGFVLVDLVEVRRLDLVVSGIRDQRRGSAPGQWVELCSAESDLRGEPGPLVQLARVDGDVLTVDANTANAIALWTPGRTNLGVRRWDQSAAPGAGLVQGAVPLVEGIPIDLEDGLVVEFAANPANAVYRSGDYWLIPARTSARGEAGTIEWPWQNGAPLAVAPHGRARHTAPLARYSPAPDTLQNLRMQFSPLAIPMP